VTHSAQLGSPASTRRDDAIGMPPQRPTLVPAERYYSAEFARLETQRMWPKVWQVACTVDHVAEPGDYFEFRSGGYSVFIVRGDDGTLRAFQNVCRHRRNSLCAGSGSDLRELRCGYLVDANWKTIAGFSETYHIQTLHPELHRCMDDVHAPQTIWGHTGKSEQLYGVPSPTTKEEMTAAEVWDAYVSTQGALMGVAEDAPFPVDRCQPDQSAADVIVDRTRAFAAGRGVDLNWASTDQVMRLHQYNVFPNMTLLTNADHLTVMTSHPGADPDRGEPVMMLWMRMPAGAPRSKPADVRMAADEAHPGLVLTQDITVLPGLQRGLHQPGFTHLALSNEERRVTNMHRNLDRYLELSEPERVTGGEPVATAAQHRR